MNQIQQVVFYLTDLTPHQLLGGSRVIIPQKLIPLVDENC